MAKLKAGYSDEYVILQCPGCDEQHHIRVAGDTKDGPVWDFNGSYDAPTFSPSVRIRWTCVEEQTKHCCHFFVRNGRIEYCGDCTHGMSNQTVELPEI